MTDEQVTKTFLHFVGCEPRTADRAVLRLPGFDTTEAMAEYIWDHWLGEPETVTVEEIQAFADKAT